MKNKNKKKNKKILQLLLRVSRPCGGLGLQCPLCPTTISTGTSMPSVPPRRRLWRSHDTLRAPTEVAIGVMVPSATSWGCREVAMASLSWCRHYASVDQHDTRFITMLLDKSILWYDLYFCLINTLTIQFWFLRVQFKKLALLGISNMYCVPVGYRSQFCS